MICKICGKFDVSIPAQAELQVRFGGNGLSAAAFAAGSVHRPRLTSAGASACGVPASGMAQEGLEERMRRTSIPFLQ